jgi:hypothetical protein
MRATGPGIDGFLLTDLRNGETLHVLPAERQVVLPSATSFNPWRVSARFERIGTDTIAGHDCIDWRMTYSVAPPSGAPIEMSDTICFTADGLMLRHLVAGFTPVVAISVTYAPQDPAGFSVPADYRRVRDGDDPPRVVPRADVLVVYDQGSGQPRTRMAFSSAAEAFRFDEDGSDMYVLELIADPGWLTVVPQHRAAALVEATSPWSPGVRFTRIGSDTIAGIACTDWAMTAPTSPGSAGTTSPRALCLSDDGVLLREVSDGLVILLAVSVEWMAQDEARFRLPPDYRRITAEELTALP